MAPLRVVITIFQHILGGGVNHCKPKLKHIFYDFYFLKHFLLLRAVACNEKEYSNRILPPNRLNIFINYLFNSKLLENIMPSSFEPSIIPMPSKIDVYPDQFELTTEVKILCNSDTESIADYLIHLIFPLPNLN